MMQLTAKTTKISETRFISRSPNKLDVLINKSFPNSYSTGKPALHQTFSHPVYIVNPSPKFTHTAPKPQKTRQTAIRNPNSNKICYYNDKWFAESGPSTQAKVHDVYHTGNDEIFHFPVQLCFLLTKYNLSYILYSNRPVVSSRMQKSKIKVQNCGFGLCPRLFD
jgi:hypothetical protein